MSINTHSIYVDHHVLVVNKCSVAPFRSIRSDRLLLKRSLFDALFTQGNVEKSFIDTKFQQAVQSCDSVRSTPSIFTVNLYRWLDEDN